MLNSVQVFKRKKYHSVSVDVQSLNVVSQVDYEKSFFRRLVSRTQGDDRHKSRRNGRFLVIVFSSCSTKRRKRECSFVTDDDLTYISLLVIISVD